MKNILSLLLLIIFCASCKKSPAGPEPVEINGNFSNVVILGNSITLAASDPSIGWNGNWGMAASAPEFDYVHILESRLKQKNNLAKLTAFNISQFERDYVHYNLDDNLKEFRKSKPDLLIIRIGENISQDSIDITVFERKYTDLITYFKSDNPSLKVLGVGSFWGNEIADRIMAEKSDFITLKSLNEDLSNYAWGLYNDQGVASHPSDKGMKAISDMIWKKMSLL